MKKNLFLAAILCIGLTALFNSCVKDTFTEQDAYNEQRKNAQQQDSIAKSQMELEAQLAMEQALLLDSLKNVGGVINYSVGVVVASESSWLKGWESGKGEKGLDGAVVTIAQHGRTFTATTDASGIASFKDLRMGTANVNVRKAGVTTVDYVVEFPPVSYEDYVYYYHEYDMDGDYEEEEEESWTQHIVEMVRHAATMVPVFSLTDNLSTIKGVATAELDLTNNAPEPVAGVNVKGIIDVDNSAFYNTYLYNPYPTKSKPYTWFDFYGYVKQIAFGSTISTATTGADGSFTLSVPSTPQGLPIRITFDEFAANQTLLLPTLGGLPVWGPQTVRTMFGYNVGTTSTVPGLGVTTSADQVQSAYVEFSAPTGTPAPKPTTDASATAVLTQSGIASINITAGGVAYTQPPLVTISKGSALMAVQASGTAVLTDGRVSSVTIDDPGSGYRPMDNPTVTFTENLQQAATATPVFGYSLGAIAVSSGGTGYTAAPSVIITSNTGTGAAATAAMSGYVSKIDVTNTGAGYTAAPVVNVAPSAGVNATATATMTTNNPVHSVYVPLSSNIWTRRKLGTRLLITSDGSGATTDSTTLSSTGRVMSLTLTNPGAGYNDNLPPTVTISGGGGTGAVAHAVSAGGVLSLVLDNAGQGFTSIPTVTIGPAPTGGTNATATALIEFQVIGVPLLSNGNGYDVAPTVQFETAPQSGTFYTPAAGIISKLSMGVASVTVGTAGTDYTTAPAITFTPSDGNVGTAAAATASILQSVKAINVTNGGSGYEKNDIAASLSAAPAGAGAATLGAITMHNGMLKQIIMGVAGQGYTAPPHVIVTVSSGSAPTKQAEISATVGGGQITALTIDDPGANYDYSGTYAISIQTFNTPAAAQAHPNKESGKIEYIFVDNPGAGYAVAPLVEIYNDGPGDANGFGTGAKATAVVVDGRITEITVTDPGSGYYVTPNVRLVVASSVMTAVGRCLVSADGRITGVDFTTMPTGWSWLTKGYGYDSAPTVTFFPSVPGKGTGATAIATVSGGRVDQVRMINEGSGYVGKNRATGLETWLTGDNRIKATAGRAVVKDLYFGTGRRTVD